MNHFWILSIFLIKLARFEDESMYTDISGGIKAEVPQVSNLYSMIQFTLYVIGFGDL